MVVQICSDHDRMSQRYPDLCSYVAANLPYDHCNFAQSTEPSIVSWTYLSDARLGRDPACLSCPPTSPPSTKSLLSPPAWNPPEETEENRSKANLGQLAISRLSVCAAGGRFPSGVCFVWGWLKPVIFSCFQTYDSRSSTLTCTLENRERGEKNSKSCD